MARLVCVRWAVLLGSAITVRVLTQHCPANLAPVNECRLLGRKLVTWEGGISMKQKHIYQIRDHLRVSFAGRLCVLLRVPVYICLKHLPTVTIGGEAGNIDAETRPASMKEQSAIFPINEPFVFHLFRDKPLTDSYHFLQRKGSIQQDSHSLRGKVFSLPVRWLGIAHLHSLPVKRPKAARLDFRSAQSYPIRSQHDMRGLCTGQAPSIDEVVFFPSLTASTNNRAPLCYRYS